MSGKSRVAISQPEVEVWEYENHWQKDMSDCCIDCKQCFCAHVCCLCFLSKLFSRTGECCCLCVIPCALMSLRSKLRTAFRIRGSICRDCFSTTFCLPCAAIQMTQQLDKYEL